MGVAASHVDLLWHLVADSRGLSGLCMQPLELHICHILILIVVGVQALTVRMGSSLRHLVHPGQGLTMALSLSEAVWMAVFKHGLLRESRIFRNVETVCIGLPITRQSLGLVWDGWLTVPAVAGMACLLLLSRLLMLEGRILRESKVHFILMGG